MLRRVRVPRFLLFALLITTLIGANPAPPLQAQGVTSPEEAARQAVSDISGAAADTVIVTLVAQDGSWAYGTGTVPAGSDHDAPDVFFFLAHDAGDGWIARIRYTPGFTELLAQAPAAFPTPEIRATLDGFTIAGDGSADMGFPFPVGQSWQFNGPHPNSGSGVWSSLDFYPSTLGENAPVTAMRGGVVYRPCTNMVMIDHGDGWTSSYYHLINISVSQGQTVSHGQQIAGTSDRSDCGGYATGPHVHVWLKYQNAEMAIAGMDIGGWTVENGAQPYDGCLSRGSERLCPANYDRVLNDGATGSGGGIATGPPAANISPTRTTVNSWITYTLTGYPANATVQITWRRLSGSTIDLGTAQTDGTGRATGRFRVPATPGGPNQQITFSSGATSKTVLFEVAPRIKVLTNPGVRGQQVNVSLRGYARQESVRIRWRKPDGSWVELARVTTSNTGSDNVYVTVPAWAPDGNNSVRGDGTVFRQQTNAVTIQGGAFQPASESVQGTASEPTPTPTATPVPIDRSALPLEPPLTIVAVTDDVTGQPITAVTDTDPATAWQIDPASSVSSAMLTADLGMPATLSGIAWLEMQAACGTIDRIETSLDGITWTAVSTTEPVPPGDPGVWQPLPASGEARYVRWTASAAEGEPALGCLAEIAVWGTLLPTPEPTEASTPPAEETATATETVPETVTPEPAPTEPPAETATEAPPETTAPPEASDQSGEP